jgi:hypothetical protein
VYARPTSVRRPQRCDPESRAPRNETPNEAKSIPPAIIAETRTSNEAASPELADASETI